MNLLGGGACPVDGIGCADSRGRSNWATINANRGKRYIDSISDCYCDSAAFYSDIGMSVQEACTTTFQVVDAHAERLVDFI